MAKSSTAHPIYKVESLDARGSADRVDFHTETLYRAVRVNFESGDGWKDESRHIAPAIGSAGFAREFD